MADDEDETNPTMIAEQPLPQQSITSGPGGELPPQGGPTSPQAQVGDLQPLVKPNSPQDASIDEVVKAALAQPGLSKIDPNDIKMGIEQIQKAHPNLSNQQLIAMAPMIVDSFNSPSFKNMVVQNHIMSQATGNADNASKPIGPTTNTDNGGAGINSYYTSQANALSRYPDAAKTVMDQGAEVQKAALAGQQQQMSQGIAANEQGQKNVQFGQQQQITSQQMDPNSGVNTWFRGQLQSLTPNTKIDPNMTIANSGDIGTKMFDMYMKQYGMSGLPTANSQIGQQVAQIDPVKLESARRSTQDALGQFQTSLGPLLSAGPLPKKAVSAALQLIQAEPNSKEAIVATQALEQGGYGNLVSAIHSTQNANNLIGSASGGTDFGIKQGMSDMLTSNNPDALKTSAERTLDRINKTVDQRLQEKTNFYNQRGMTNNETIPNNPVSSAPPAQINPSKVAPIQKVLVQDKNGKKYKLPSSQLQQALQSGYTQVK